MTVAARRRPGGRATVGLGLIQCVCHRLSRSVTQPRRAARGRWPPVTGDQSLTGHLAAHWQCPGGTESESLPGTGSAPQFTPFHSTYYVFACIYTYMYVYVGICKYMHVSVRISMALAENVLSTKCMYMYVLYVLVRTVYLSACICWYLCI